MNLDEAKDVVERGKWDRDGVRCPCCDEFHKVYRRSLGSSMARWLIELVRLYSEDETHYHYSTGTFAGMVTGDVAKLVHWDLIAPMPDPLPDQQSRRSGYWRPTSHGIDFVCGRVRVSQFRYEHKNKWWSDAADPQITIVDALGDGFNYSALMTWEILS